MRHVRAIEVSGAFKHEGSRVELPAEGIVVVTGENGAGKSGFFVEAVPLALWGDTLRGVGHRGCDPWTRDPGVVAVEFVDGLRVARTRSKSRSDLRWALDGDPAAARFETATKAQEALEAHVGGFDVWRRSSAFSSSDASAFMQAADGERKRLLEAVAGGPVDFDAALSACRVDLNAAETKAAQTVNGEAQAGVEIARLGAELERLRASLARFEAEAPAALEVPAGKTARELGALVKATEADIASVLSRRSKADRAGGEAAAAARQVGDALRRFEGMAACPTCGQAVGEDLLESLRRSARKLAEQAEAERKAAEAERAAVADELADLEAERAALVRKRDARAEVERLAESRAAERARWDEARRNLAGSLAMVEAEAEKAGRSREDWQGKAREARIEVLTLRAVETVLGLRGARAGLLGRALGGIEAISNGWLARLGIAGLRLKLRGYTEKKTGGTSEAISAEVLGAGGGNYWGASSGERRRLDVAILLALSEVAAAARGVKPGTMFFDEVFDAISAAGLGDVVRVLREFARGRCVVVVTHRAELARDLPAVARYHVEAGKVARVS